MVVCPDTNFKILFFIFMISTTEVIKFTPLLFQYWKSSTK